MKYYILLFVLLLISCGEKTTTSDKEYLLHVAHTRLFDTINQKIDPLLEELDYGTFSTILLGGDITEETSKKESTLQYVDSIFDLDSQQTLWALGNHDNENLEWVEKYTKRPYTYSYHRNGITYVVLYTQEDEDWKCHITGDQLNMIQNVCDTISESSHLIVMTHKLVWIMNNPELKQHQGQSYYDWSCNYRIHKTNWNDDILPRLRTVQNRGTKVICLAGDIGNNVKTFEEQTQDSIVYLASGIQSGNEQSQVLIFEHNPKEKRLVWNFANLESYTNSPKYQTEFYKNLAEKK